MTPERDGPLLPQLVAEVQERSNAVLPPMAIVWACQSSVDAGADQGRSDDASQGCCVMWTMVMLPWSGDWRMCARPADLVASPSCGDVAGRADAPVPCPLNPLGVDRGASASIAHAAEAWATAALLSLASPKGPPSLPATWDHLAPTSAGWPDDHGDRPMCQTRRRRGLGGRGSAGAASRAGFSLLR